MMGVKGSTGVIHVDIKRSILIITPVFFIFLFGLSLVQPMEYLYVIPNSTEWNLTTNQGCPISNDKDSLTVGNRGPVLLADMILLEKLAHFNRERIPERVVHARGAGAFGYFQCNNSMSNYTKAAFLQEAGKKTPVLVRFSTTGGGRGSVDTVRDVRGFAVKFYTEEGNYDIVGNSIPVFFLRDTMKFADLNHAAKAAPNNNIPSKNNFWDFISRTPEATNTIVWLFSDRGTPASYRMMEGFGVHTFKWVDKYGNASYVKYHWKPRLGVRNMDRQNATRIAGEDPDYMTRDLWNAIARGEYPEYELKVQVMNISEELNQTFDPLDDTKIWPEDKFPLIPVGIMVLDRNPQNYFTEIEQSAFSPANFVPGIEPSDDKCLMGRIFGYPDAQRYRLGPNYQEIPVNRPLVEVVNNQRDGPMQMQMFNGSINYEPNRLQGSKPAPSNGSSHMNYVEGNCTRESIYKTDDFTQAGQRYRYAGKNEHLVENLIDSLKQADVSVQKLEVENLRKADANLGKSVALGLGLE